MNGLNIGDEVAYIRHNQDGISEGAGLLKGIGLDGEGRTIVLLKDGDKSFNTFLVCVNPTPEFCEKFRAHCAEIEALAQQANDSAKSIVESANASIAEMRNAIFGAPLLLDDKPEEKGEPI